MLNENINITEFLQAILKYAENEEKTVLNYINSYKEKELSNAEKDGIKAAYDYVQKQTENFENELLRDFAIRDYQSRQSVFLKREAYINEIFDTVTKKLLKYTESEEYRDYLFKVINKIVSKNYGMCKIFIGKKDIKYKSDIENFVKGCTVCCSDDIKIGGLRFLFFDKKIVIDETLDAKLYDEKSKFILGSGMKIY